MSIARGVAGLTWQKRRTVPLTLFGDALTLRALWTGQTRRKAGTQSHRSNGRVPMTAGLPRPRRCARTIGILRMI